MKSNTLKQPNADDSWNRSEAISLTIKLFSTTDFSKLLQNPSNPLTVNDVPFYSTVEDIKAYLDTGKFPNFELFKKSQKEAQKKAS